MNRALIFLAAAASAAIAVTSACLAEVRTSDAPFRPDGLQFTLKERGDSAANVEFHLYQGGDRHNGSFNSGTRWADLGLDPSALRRDGPLAFAMVHEPGRIDCRGTVRNRQADGDCRFTADAGFNAFLAANGVRVEKIEDSYGMTMTGVSRQLVSALHDAGYGPPDADQLMAFAAVGVDAAYIADLSRRGYKPRDLDDLIAFRAVGVTPEYIQGMAQAGYGRIEGEQLIAMRSLGITPDYVAGFNRIGYTNLDPEKLVEMKALGVTPAMLQAVDGDRTSLSLPQRAVARDVVDTYRR